MWVSSLCFQYSFFADFLVNFTVVLNSVTKIRALTLLFHDIWSGNSVPRSWRESITNPIQKEGKDPTWVKNFRPIALANTDSKVFTGILNWRLMPWLQMTIPTMPAGFLAGSTTELAILQVM